MTNNMVLCLIWIVIGILANVQCLNGQVSIFSYNILWIMVVVLYVEKIVEEVKDK